MARATARRNVCRKVRPPVLQTKIRERRSVCVMDHSGLLTTLKMTVSQLVSHK